MRTLCVALAFVLSSCLAGAAHEVPSDPVPSARASVAAPASYARPDIVDVGIGDGLPSMRPRPDVRVPVPSPRVVVVGTPKPPRLGRTLVGTASWFCGHGSRCTAGYPGGFYAAAGPLLRVGQWRNRVVTVRAVGGETVRVRLVDWCACPQRLLDLYSDAFQRLAPLSRGLVKVTVTW